MVECKRIVNHWLLTGRTFEFHSSEVYSIQHYVIKFVSDLRQVSSFLRVLRFPPPINWPSQYIWNIIESGVNEHKPNPWKVAVDQSTYYFLWKRLIHAINVLQDKHNNNTNIKFMWIRCKTWERIGTPRMSQFPRHIYIDFIFKDTALILCIRLVYTGLLR
jgi:hypothetical protein